MSAIYYIAKGQKTLGPCTLDDLRNFLAYGSIQRGDLVMQDGEEQWRPVATLMDVAENGESATGEGGLAKAPLRRRTIRYRDYERVPPEKRAGRVLKWIILGFLFFPPMLWRASVWTYSNRIFRSAADEDGYLKTWPRRVDVPLTLLIMVNAILWWIALTWLTNTGGPIVRDFLDALSSGMRSFGEILK